MLKSIGKKYGESVESVMNKKSCQHLARDLLSKYGRPRFMHDHDQLTRKQTALDRGQTDHDTILANPNA